VEEIMSKQQSYGTQSGNVEHAIDKATDTVGGMVGKAGASRTTEASDFVEKAAISDQYEIAAAEIALERSSTAPIRAAAERMITDHRANTEKMKTAVARSQKVDMAGVPETLDTRRARMVEHLSTAPDGSFDETYVDQQKLAHEEAVSLMQTFRDDGDCPELRAFAGEAANVVESHLEQMKQLQENYS
jgi:putative membrane protein